MRAISPVRFSERSRRVLFCCPRSVCGLTIVVAAIMNVVVGVIAIVLQRRAQPMAAGSCVKKLVVQVCLSSAGGSGFGRARVWFCHDQYASFMDANPHDDHRLEHLCFQHCRRPVSDRPCRGSMARGAKRSIHSSANGDLEGRNSHCDESVAQFVCAEPDSQPCSSIWDCVCKSVHGQVCWHCKSFPRRC